MITAEKEAKYFESQRNRKFALKLWGYTHEFSTKWLSIYGLNKDNTNKHASEEERKLTENLNPRKRTMATREFHRKGHINWLFKTNRSTLKTYAYKKHYTD